MQCDYRDSQINYLSLCLYRDEMEEVVASVYDLMGKTADPQLEEELIKQRVDAMFQVHKGCVSSH